MKFKNNLITTLEFRAMHPESVVSDSDVYFTSLANKILRALQAEKLLAKSSDERFLRQFALKSVAYFEDVVSRWGLFDGFRKLHLQKFGTKLPFYTLGEDYCDDEINSMDIQFLVWATMQGESNEDGENRFLNPENPGIEFISRKIFTILEDEYETAPENERVHELLHEWEYDDFFSFREILNWLYLDSYISMSHPRNNLEDIKISMREQGKKDKQFPADSMIYLVESNAIFNYVCTPLSVKPIEWFRAITTNESILKKTEHLASRPFQHYKIMDCNNNTVNLLPFDSEEMLQLSRESVNINDKTIKIGETVMQAALVFFDGWWHTNGMVVFSEMYNKIQETEDKRLDWQKQHEENAAYSHSRIVKYNKNNPIAFLKDTEELKKFWFGAFPETPADQNFFTNNLYKNEENFVLFSYPRNGAFIQPDTAKIIKYPDNKLYDEKFAQQEGVALLTGGYSAPLEFLEFIISNDYIPDACINSLKGAEYGRQLVQKNKWFIVHFFQPELFDDKIFGEIQDKYTEV